MSSLIEKFQQEIEKGQAERMAHEQNVALDERDPANAAKIREAKIFYRKVGVCFALVGAAMLGLTYGFYAYAGDLYLILGLLGSIAFVFGLYQTIAGKAVGKSK